MIELIPLLLEGNIVAEAVVDEVPERIDVDVKVDVDRHAVLLAAHESEELLLFDVLLGRREAAERQHLLDEPADRGDGRFLPASVATTDSAVEDFLQLEAEERVEVRALEGSAVDELDALRLFVDLLDLALSRPGDELALLVLGSAEEVELLRPAEQSGVEVGDCFTPGGGDGGAEEGEAGAVTGEGDDFLKDGDSCENRVERATRTRTLLLTSLTTLFAAHNNIIKLS